MVKLVVTLKGERASLFFGAFAIYYIVRFNADNVSFDKLNVMDSSQF